MALKKEALSRIASILKIKEADLEAAIKDEKEVDVAIDEKIQTYTEDELSTLKNNEYTKGKTAGVEIAVKEAKEELKLDFTGKTIKGLIDASNKKALEDAKIEPEKKVQEIQEKLATVQKNYQDLEQKVAEKEQEVRKVKRATILEKSVPALGEDGPVLDPSDIIGMMESKGYEFVEDASGNIVPKKDGKALEDKLGNALPVKDVITGFMKERKYISDGDDGKGGRGGSGGGGGKAPAAFSKLSELKKHFEESGKSLLGEEFLNTAKKLKETNVDFDMNA